MEIFGACFRPTRGWQRPRAGLRPCSPLGPRAGWRAAVRRVFTKTVAVHVILHQSKNRGHFWILHKISHLWVSAFLRNKTSMGSTSELSANKRVAPSAKQTFRLKIHPFPFVLHPNMKRKSCSSQLALSLWLVVMFVRCSHNN